METINSSRTFVNTQKQLSSIWTPFLSFKNLTFNGTIMQKSLLRLQWYKGCTYYLKQLGAVGSHKKTIYYITPERSVANQPILATLARHCPSHKTDVKGLTAIASNCSIWRLWKIVKLGRFLKPKQCNTSVYKQDKKVNDVLANISHFRKQMPLIFPYISDQINKQTTTAQELYTNKHTNIFLNKKFKKNK